MVDKKYNHILENPILTDIGYFHYIKTKDYDTFNDVVGVVNLDKIALVNYFKKLTQENSQLQPFLDIVTEFDMFSFIRYCGLPEYRGTFISELNEQYVELFKFCTKCNNNIVFELIKSDEDFQEYLNLIRKMNGIPYEPTSPNPEIERRNQLTRKLAEMKNEGVDFECMFTSVCVDLKKTPTEVGEISLYAFYKLFSRIGQFKHYDSSVLFATVSTEVKVEPWYKSDVFSKKENYITEDQLKSAIEQGSLQSDL